MSKSKKAAKSVVVIIFFTVCSKFLGFFREMLIAAKYGADANTDTFFIALTAISLFTAFITKSINTTMIPVLSEIEAKEGKEGKKNHTNNLLSIVSFLSLLTIILAWILSPCVIKIIAFGFEGEQFELTVLMMRIGLPAILFASIQGVFRGYLQSELMFTESAIATFPFNFVYIFFLISLASFFDIRGLMMASLLATASQILIQIFYIGKTNFRYKYIFDLKDRYVNKIVRLIPPIFISAGIGDINRIIDKSMASTLAEGSISALNYGNRLDKLTTSIFISAIITVIFPMLSQEANKEIFDGLKKIIIRGINVILIITIPATVGIIVLARPIVRVTFQRGAFDSTAAYMTVGALVFYSIGLVSSAVKSLLGKVYYSLQDTKTPMVNSFIALGLNVILNLIFIRFMGHRGLALATSISSIITMMFLLYMLKKKIGSFGFLGSIKCGIKSLFASIVMGVVVYYLDMGLAGRMGSGTLPELIALLVSVGVGVLIYSVIIYLFRIEEVNWIIKVVKGKLRK
ncbi:MAG: murein biosynthesis integral membrane protein MurJ [Firmicutes bacterium]|nr:murein biosynthesis integral membrane protein MurJ [Bacillota bacterium]